MDQQKFDIVVVGSGQGYQPKKYLGSNAEAVTMASHLFGRGIKTAPKTDWQSLQALKYAFLNGRFEADFKNWQQMRDTTFHGRAVMTGENEISVGHDRLEAKHIVLATGATPRCLDIPGTKYVMIATTTSDGCRSPMIS